jgi:hypothetical protein
LLLTKESKGGRLKRKAPVVEENDDVTEEAVANDSDGEEEIEGMLEDMEEDGVAEAKADSKMYASLCCKAVDTCSPKPH